MVGNKPAHDPTNKNRIKNVLTWAVNNLHQKINTYDLANRAFLTRSTFDRHFRETMQTSPHAWLTKVRLEKAQSLLASSNVSIETVARSCGYVSALSLRISFKKQLGLTPGQFRKLQ
ncbi:helix-turn-helix domain-containing protein [Algibacillus agarilyticus]|uniref:helix-turn-helix domain-containing protein n=1 Tax=Algibacillus agarilyticus TaxID=2234133 RepID=UPI001300319F|nr:helix-turn-helix domain-containing protein [Algibacillus agarilyticus]